MKLQWPFRLKSDPGDIEAKALSFVPQTAAWEFGMPGSRLPGSNVNYAAEVREGMYSSVVTSALCWMMRTFPEAPVCVQRKIEGRWEDVEDHQLAELIRTPNPEYGGRVLWMATVMDFCYGEAYWKKVFNGHGDLMELWWIPRQSIQPIADPETGLLHHYLYQPGLGIPSEDLKPNQVVHFRFGKDPLNLLRGFSPLAAVMREVFTDDQAATFTSAILKNLGIIGIVFSPEQGGMTKEQADKLKDYVQSAFTGDKRGQAMFFTNKMNANLLAYNMQGFDISPIRDIAEERVCAALAIPAAVIGFGTGLQQTKVGATMREMVKLAWQGGIEPVQAIMADELDRSALPEFHTNNLGKLRCHFDTSQVEALTESPKEKTDRVTMLVEANIIKVSQAQRELGYPVDPSQDKYARELTPAPVAQPSPASRIPADAMNGNGNGKPPVQEPADA